MAVVKIDDFSKGVNVADSPGSVAEGYLPVALNATGRGKAVVQRFGTTKRGVPAATASFVYHSPIFSTYLFVQEGTALKRYTLGPFMGSPTTIKTFTTGAKIAACDFIFGASADRGIVFVHPVDGVFTYDGTTFSARVGSPVKGDTIAVWQNKVYVGGDSAEPPRVWWCNAGRADLWTTAEDFVDMREINDEQVTALGIGNGMDATGRGGLNVFKRSSAYVIIDSETGEYVTIDAYRGAENHEAVTAGAGGIYCANNIGIYRVTDSGLEEIHGAVKPVWDDPNVGFRSTVAWAYSDRLYFCPSSAYIFEYVPAAKAWWVHSLNKNGVGTGVQSATSTSDATSGRSQPRPYLLDTDGAFVLDMWDDVNGHAYVSGIECQDYAEGDPTGNGPYSVTMTIRLPWLINDLDDFRVDRCMIRGWGGGAGGVTVTPKIITGFAATGTTRATFTLGGSSVSEDDAQINQLGVHRAFQLELSGSGVTSEQFPNPDPAASIPIQAPPLGISSVRFDVVNLRE